MSPATGLVKKALRVSVNESQTFQGYWVLCDRNPTKQLIHEQTRLANDLDSQPLSSADTMRFNHRDH
ncbi:MAG TPA: hypothetical protein V6D11_07755 [Waterburya sp.]